MTPYTINDLPALASLTANDYIPVWDSEASGEPTYKIKVSDMIASMVLIASLLKQDDVVNDLTSAEMQKPGSANMLRTLYQMFAMTANEKITVTALTGYSSVANLTISEDGLYSFDTSNSGSSAVNLILDIRSENNVTFWHSTYMSAPQYASIQSPPMYLIAGTYKLRATGDASQMYRYEYRA